MNKLFNLVLPAIFIVASCSSKEPCAECEAEKNGQDTLVNKKEVSLEQELKAETVVTETKEAKENRVKIEKKYGEQWDFCTCVIANDSINKAFEKNVTDKQAEKLMARWEHVENKCKEFLTQPNTTPEERAIHEKRVKKCLRDAKVK